MSANAADLVPAVEAYLEANGLKETLSAMKAEAKAKKMTPSKTVRARTDTSRRAPRDERHRRNLRRFLRRLIDTAPPLDPRFAAVTRGVSLTVALVDSLTPQAKNLNADLTEMANVFMETRCVPIAAAARRSLFRPPPSSRSFRSRSRARSTTDAEGRRRPSRGSTPAPALSRIVRTARVPSRCPDRARNALRSTDTRPTLDRQGHQA